MQLVYMTPYVRGIKHIIFFSECKGMWVSYNTLSIRVTCPLTKAIKCCTENAYFNF